jgi:glycosyltransferase involved in cell wall biosynthesis
MTSPRVTVIVATYNWSTVLPFSIGSVLGQTFRDFELLVVGDGCTDDSERVVAAIGDARVRWINLPEHTGHQSSPNNRGLAEARGEFVAYLGHDDLWLPHYLQSAIDALEAADAGLACSIAALVPPGADTALPHVPKSDAQAWTPPSATVYRRSVTTAIGGWRDYRQMRLTPEVELRRRAHAAGFKCVVVPRLGTIKFAAGDRRNVYREKPCHEQAKWLRRIQTDEQFEASQLALMLMDEKAIRLLPGHALARELARRLRARFWLGFGLIRIYWPRKGTNIDATRKYKGL